MVSGQLVFVAECSPFDRTSQEERQAVDRGLSPKKLLARPRLIVVLS
jgi:hypothetical protein